MQQNLFEDIEFSNPKRGSNAVSSAYDYYAGYSEQFVEKILQNNKEDGPTVLDPWNGAGTTTTSAGRLSIKSIGLDLNPVMTTIAKASFAGRSSNAILQAQSCIASHPVKYITASKSDPLRSWFDQKSVANIRGFLATIFGTNDGIIAPNNAQDLDSPLALILYCTFSHLKYKYKASSHRTSNPTWIKKNKDGKNLIEISKDELQDSVLHQLAMLSSTDLGKHSKSKTPKILTADSRSIPLKDNSIDLVISSPPYCTRIDYAVKTSIEYATAFGDQGFEQLRRTLLGTTTVEKSSSIELSESSYCKDLLEKIRCHNSKASHSYYYKNILQYFQGLDKSIKEIARVLRPGGNCYLVIQDSFYKDILISLHQATRELCELAGLFEQQSLAFPVSLNIGNINTSSRKYRKENSINEHVLHVRKRN